MESLRGIGADLLLAGGAWLEVAGLWQTDLEGFTLSWALPSPRSTSCPTCIFELLSSTIPLSCCTFLSQLTGLKRESEKPFPALTNNCMELCLRDKERDF